MSISRPFILPRDNIWETSVSYRSRIYYAMVDCTMFINYEYSETVDKTVSIFQADLDDCINMEGNDF